MYVICENIVHSEILSPSICDVAFIGEDLVLISISFLHVSQ